MKSLDFESWCTYSYPFLVAHTAALCQPLAIPAIITALSAGVLTFRLISSRLAKATASEPRKSGKCETQERPETLALNLGRIKLVGCLALLALSTGQQPGDKKIDVLKLVAFQDWSMTGLISTYVRSAQYTLSIDF